MSISDQLQTALDERPADPWRTPMSGHHSTTITKDDLKSANDPSRIVDVGGDLEITAKQAVQVGLLREDQGEFVAADEGIQLIDPNGPQRPTEPGQPVDPTAPHVAPDLQTDFNDVVDVLTVIERDGGIDSAPLVDALIEGVRSIAINDYRPNESAMEALRSYQGAVRDDEFIQKAVDTLQEYGTRFVERIAEHDNISMDKLRTMAPSILADGSFPAALSTLFRGGQAGIAPMRTLIHKHLK